MSFRSKKDSRQASIIFALTLLKLLDIFYNLIYSTLNFAIFIFLHKAFDVVSPN